MASEFTASNPPARFYFASGTECEDAGPMAGTEKEDAGPASGTEREDAGLERTSGGVLTGSEGFAGAPDEWPPMVIFLFSVQVICPLHCSILGQSCFLTSPLHVPRENSIPWNTSG